jgi:glutaredoxin-like YruB-family protein
MKKVKIYTTPTCIYCKLAKEFFKKNKIKYEEFDVSEDEKARDEMIRKTQQLGVPVIEINSEIIIGFDKSRIEKILNLKS